MNPENTTVSHKQRRGSRYAPPTNAWKPGVSGNPVGAPRKGASHAEWLRTIDDWTPAQMVEFLKRSGASSDHESVKYWSKQPQDVLIRTLAVETARRAATRRPSPAWFDSLADRADGKVEQRVASEITIRLAGALGVVPGQETSKPTIDVESTATTLSATSYDKLTAPPAAPITVEHAEKQAQAVDR